MFRVRKREDDAAKMQATKIDARKIEAMETGLMTVVKHRSDYR